MITGEAIAVKMEPIDSESPNLCHEWKVYKSLGSAVGIPCMLWFGTEWSHKAMVMNILGPSLEDLFTACNCTFSLKTVLMLADQLVSDRPSHPSAYEHVLSISHIEYVHDHHYVHCDIKPNNILMGIHQDAHHVNIIDFCLANKYCDESTLDYIPYQTYKNLTGTGQYMSINSHLGIEHMRCDDLELLAHVLIYFLHGSLPWQHLEGGSTKQWYHHIRQWKLNTPTIELCSGLCCEFQIFLDYMHGLSFDAEPNYEYMCSLFQNLFVARGYHNDSSFDWRWMDLSLFVFCISDSGSDTESK